MKGKIIKMAKRDCPWYNEPMEDAPVIHDVALCETTERLKGRDEIKNLKESVENWRTAWYSNREIIADLWWGHPAIDNDEQRVYYQNNLKEIAEINSVGESK